jgi:hypothetical protein
VYWSASAARNGRVSTRPNEHLRVSEAVELRVPAVENVSR